MNVLDYLLIALVAAAVYGAVRYVVRQRKRGGCGGCSGCSGCSGGCGACGKRHP